MKTKTTRISRYLFGTLLTIFAICSTGLAITLFDTGTSVIVSGDATQMGRISRATSAVPRAPSDWSTTPSSFPGTANPGTSYHYHTFTVPASTLAKTPFVQLTIDDPVGNVFVSAYLDSYNPASEATNYLGDQATSGNPLFSLAAGRTDLSYFQVAVPSGHDLVVLVNETPGGPSTGEPYRVLAEGFTDTQFSNPSTPTPTPTPKPTPPAISIAVAPQSVKEGKNATFTFTASPVAHAAITVNFQMSGQATNGSDYTLSAVSVPMGTNQATATVTLKSKVDALNEGSETATMTVTSGTGYTVGSPSQATVLIKDN